MIIFLKKVRVSTIFSKFDPVIVEPLELCYLKSVLKTMNIENYLIDSLFGLEEPENIAPDLIILTGYNVAENKVLKEAKMYKEKFPDCKIIVGGVHIQLNRESFQKDDIDYVIHSQSLHRFKKVIQSIIDNSLPIFKGVDYYNNGHWHLGEIDSVLKRENILADRSLFYNFKNKLRYLEKSEVALIKGSIGCPYNCSYCFCKDLNQGKYIRTNYEKMAEEINGLDANYYWVVDDVLFANRIDALEFIHSMKTIVGKKSIIGYLRGDFILKEQDLLAELKIAGLKEVIVGFEATNNEELESYDKTINALDYPKIISLLKDYEIDLTALFIVQADYKIKDFYNLYRFIKNNKIEVFTISILTPIKGTKNYNEEKMDLTTLNPEKYDFLHLVKKSKLPKVLFYTLFYGIHLRLLKSKRVWKYISGKS
ncbi:MAG: hypothetical protein GX787_00440 [Tissierellia bacterium]|jgi:radical SAM superfamily enzyme YgiQ (UPF0313 family)|nr:hypothetical protein [Tissierellia bacterium]